MAVGLTLGAVDLLGSYNTSPGWWIEFDGDNHDQGAPQDVEQEVLSFLQDGAIVTVQRRNNRELSVPLAIKGASVANLADGEAALVAELGKRSLLTYTPSGNGSPCVFDVVTSSLASRFEDVAEKQALTAYYTLTIKALPYVKAQDAVTVSWAAPANTAPTTAGVDPGTSTTGWSKSATPNGTSTGPTVSGGGITAKNTRSGGASGSATISVTLTRSGLSASMTTTPYVRLDFSATYNALSGGEFASVATVQINGTTVTPVASSGSVSWYAMPGGATTLTSVSVTSAQSLSVASYVTARVDDITRSSQTYDAAAPRQSFRSVAVGGSVRTQGSLQLWDATPASLGTVLVYTSPNTGPTAQPSLRQYLAAGPSETVDSTVVSGKTSDLGTLHSFYIPVTAVPAGQYVLLARMKHASTATYSVQWKAGSVQNGAFIESSVPGGSLQTDTVAVPLTAGAYKVVTLGRMVLPASKMGSDGQVYLEIIETNHAAVKLDEAWLFNTDTGRLTVVDCGTGTPGTGINASVVFVDAPTLDTPTPAVSIGSATDRSDSFAAGGLMTSFGDHELIPPSMNVFTVATNSAAMQGQITYSPRSHTRVP